MLAFGIFFSGCEVNQMANEYISPTGFNDPNGSWTDESSAYDGDIQTPAYCSVPANNWSNYLELTISAIYCSKVKFLALYNGTQGINKIDLDIYYDGAWHDVYEGSFLSRVYVEKTFTTQYVTKMRMRFYNNGSEVITAVLGEAAFYETIGVPEMTTVAATGVSGGEATLNGNMVSNGGAVPTVRGFKYKEGIGGAEQDTHDSGYFEIGTYSKDLTGLDPTKEYYFKAYATNTAGTGYGEWLSLGEAISIPTLSSSAATSIDHEKATLNGEITETGGEDPTERGFQWKIGATGDIEELPETGEFGVGTYSLLLEELSANTQYYFRAYAKNAGGTGYGTWLNFTTEYTTPEVTTHNATDELTTQVTGNGEIVSTGGQDCDERGFDYGLAKVATWEKKETAGSYGIGFFDLDITGLSANTEYWYRAYAKYLLKSSESQKTTSNYEKYNIRLQVFGDKIYFVWDEYDGSNYQIWTAVMDIDGSNFTATKRTTSATDKQHPQLQVVGDIIYYVWDEEDLEIWTATTTLAGASWSATKRETNTESTSSVQFQVVGDTIYFSWQESDGTNKQVWTATMTTAGADWTATKRTSDATTKTYIQFQVVGDTIYFVYLQTGGELWTATMTIAGADWTATEKVDNNCHFPQLEVVGDKIYFVYADDSSPLQLYTAVMDIDGSNWSSTKRTSFTDPAQNVWEIQLQVVGNKIYYIFSKQLSGGNKYIYLAHMDIDGTNWVQTLTITGASKKQTPQFQVIDDIIYYVWTEEVSDGGTYYQIWTCDNVIAIGYGEWLKFITAATGTIPTGTKKVICSDYSGYTYRTQASETDDGAEYVAYFVISTDLTNKKGLAYYKRILDLHLYFKNQISGTVTVEVKRDSEPAWQEVGDVTLTGIEEILVKHLATNIRAKHFLFKLSATNKFKFLGCLFESIKEGNR